MLFSYFDFKIFVRVGKLTQHRVSTIFLQLILLHIFALKILRISGRSKQNLTCDPTHQNRPVTGVDDILCPGDGGFREAVCITSQQSRATNVGCSVDLWLPRTDGGKH